MGQLATCRSKAINGESAPLAECRASEPDRTLEPHRRREREGRRAVIPLRVSKERSAELMPEEEREGRRVPMAIVRLKALQSPLSQVLDDNDVPTWSGLAPKAPWGGAGR